jgi:cysteine desulfurase
VVSERSIYLDYAASTPVDPRVADAMLAALDSAYSANASSPHRPGRAALRLIEEAAAAIAMRIGGEPEALVFTSGATESNQLALMGTADGQSGEIITTRIEHASVLASCAVLARRGIRLRYLECDADGLIAPAQLAAALSERTLLVSIMHVNNETGVTQDTEALAHCCRERGVRMHVDAAQSIGKVEVDVARWAVDLVSLSAHKSHGPKGIGALYVRPGTGLMPQIVGGEQQRGLRAGTLPTHQIVGMGRAYALADPATEGPRLRELGGRLRALLAAIPDVRFNGPKDQCAPHIVNVSFPGLDGESLLAALADVAVATGAACHSDAAEPSRILTAMGRSEALASASLRFSIGRDLAADDIAYAVARVAHEVARLRELARGAPAWCST